MFRRAATALLVLAASGCAAHPAPPANVSFAGVAVMAAPQAALPSAPPRILSVWFSGDAIPRGRTWYGKIVTTTNVASVEVRTNLFSIDVPRRGFGQFGFALRVFDVPPIFVRGYMLRIIARNAAGAQAEEDLPFRIQ